MKNPKTVDEMLTMLDNIETVLESKPYSVQVEDYKILGVPVRYLLVPISHYLDLKLEKLYLKLEEITLEKFTKMLSNIRNFSNVNCIRKSVYDQYNLSDKFIFNKRCQITIDIENYEKELIDITKAFFPKAVNTLKEYKVHKCDEKELLSLISEFESKFDIMEVEKKIRSFIESCEKELADVHFDDSKEHLNEYELFVDKFSLEKWLSSEKDRKIILQTNGEAPEGKT
jgi:hypothetical protein